MSSNWKDCTLGDVLTLQRGMDLPTQDRKNGPVPIVASNGVVGYHNVAPVKGPGVIIGRSGSIGGGQYVTEDFWPLNTTLWVKDFKGNNPRFCYYLLRSIDFSGLNAGSGVPTLNRNHLHPMPLVCPSVEEQVSISRLLGSLDDRITLLRETNTTLEAIAQALFKSWFVDFDPVRAKQEGCELEGMDADTAALFPDSFEESELGLVPKGWNQVPFTDTVHVIGGGTPKTSMPEYWNGDIPWFSVVDAPTITDVFVIDTQKHITELGLNNSSTKLLAKGTTIISARGTVGRLALVGRQMAMNQSCYGLRGKADDTYFTYFSTYRLVESLKQRSHGSVFDTITTETMKGVFVIYPDKAIIQTFEALLQPVMDRMQKNLEKAQTLATLRDTLLPRLISGQLRLPDAEILVEEATA
ncbi:MAG: restriction endonuclease subunit S [Desulfuromonadaceae bacterium]|nr:restriction endonuclease subunit S [Desulfuromonadaceae bacterium]